MKSTTLSILWAAVLLAIAPSLGAQNVSKTARVSKAADSFLSGAPFTLDQVIRLIGQDAIPLKRRKDAIQNRGVDFSMSAEAVARLKAAGAIEEILDLIKNKARPAPPPTPDPPKPPPAGNLSVTCAPAECEVAVNGTPRGGTTAGALQLNGIEPGNYAIDLTHAGYVTQQNSVTVEADKTAHVSATLAPTRETQEAFGSALFQKMLQAIGGDEGLTALATLSATGSANILTHDGRSIRWTVKMRTRPGHALFHAKSGVLDYEVLFTGNEFTASKSLKGQDVLDLPTAFGLVRDNDVAAMLAKLNKQEYKMSASQPQPAPDAEFALTAEGGNAKIAIGLDTDSRPQRVRITTETGMGSMLITYSDFVQVGQAWYPKTMQVKPDAQQHGIDVHFDTVELDTKSKDSDFRLKNKIFSNGYNEATLGLEGLPSTESDPPATRTRFLKEIPAGRHCWVRPCSNNFSNLSGRGEMQ